MFFDTETNGLPPMYTSLITDMPRIVQISWIVADEDGNIEKRCGYLVKPTHFDISEDAVKVHGITEERAMSEGKDIKDVISLFMDDLNGCNAIVGHNVSFDIQVLRGELERLNMPDEIMELPTYCTMRLSVDYCKIPTQAAYIRSFSQYLSYTLRHPREYKYKFPKLAELYDFLFDETFDNAHDASADIEATNKCFFELLRRKVINYKPTDKTYCDIVVSIDRTTNILNDNIISYVEKWKIYNSSDGWRVKAILKKDRIIKIPFLHYMSDNGILLDSPSVSLLNVYGLSLCDYFYINSPAILVSKANIARINVNTDYLEIFDVHRENIRNSNLWRTKSVRSFTKEEQEAVKEAEVISTQYGKSVHFIMASGGETSIPLSNTSSLSVGMHIDLSKGKIIVLCREGDNDICRVIEQ